MFGFGPAELVIIAFSSVFYLVPLVAGVIIIRMAASGRLGGPKHCPHCGADLRAPSKQHGQPV